MIQKVTDTFHWKKRKGIILGMDNIYDLFDP